MLDAKAKPQILEHLSKSLTVTVYDTKWVLLPFQSVKRSSCQF